MTGRDLIIYILQNNLEDVKIIDYKVLGFMTVDEAAVKFGASSNTIKAWVGMKWLPSVTIGEIIYIPANAKPKEYELY